MPKNIIGYACVNFYLKRFPAFIYSTDVDHSGQRGPTPPPSAQQLHQDITSGLSAFRSSQTNSNGSIGSGGPQIFLSELPEPPIPVSEIGPIPPPAMFSTPSPTAVSTARTHAGVIQQLQQQQHQLQQQQQQIPQQPPPSYSSHITASNGIVGIHNPQDEYDYDGKSNSA